MSDDDQLRALLRDVPAPDPTARERALAAAMAVYEEQQPPHRRSTRWLMPVAAGLVGVVAIGGALAVVLPGEDRLEPTAAVADRTGRSPADDNAGEPDDAEAAVVAAGAAEEAPPTLAAAPVVTGDDAVMIAPASTASLPRVGSDADLIDVAVAPAPAASATVACGRDIVATVLDERTADATRVVLLARETTPDAAFVVVLAPEGEDDACVELDRLALP